MQLHKVENISPYLSSGDNILVRSVSNPINNLPKMVFGSMPRDGGHLIISSIEERNKIVYEWPVLASYIKKYIGAEEFINDKCRYVFWLDKIGYEKIKDNFEVKKRIEAVERFRLSSKAESTKVAAKIPYAFVQKGEWCEAYLNFKQSRADDFLQILIPRVSSENREYVPMGFVDEDTIISDSAMVIYNAPVWLLGILQSKMHMVWLSAIGGKLKMDYRYSAGLVYNTFPVPELSAKRKSMIEEQIFNILDLREELGGSLAELYHRDTMPEELRNAHRKLDEIVERAYREVPFKSDEDRLSYLLKRYKEIINE